MMRRFLAGLVCLAFVVAGVQFLPAQTATTGQVAGDVVDPTGAIVLGAKVTLTNEAGVKRETTTDAAGRYLVPMLPPGTYTVEVAAKGFGNVRLQNVAVRITETTVLNVSVKLATTAESVEVTAAQPLVQTESATAGKVIEQASISQLPLPTRNFQQLLALTPGASGSLANSSELGRGDAVITVNGQRTTSNAVVINGADATSIGTGATPNLAVPATDSMREFIVQTSLYDASQGRSSGGVIAAVTKSGTNNFHGNAYEFLRNSALNANNFFLNRDGIEKPALTRNLFGGTLGGPVVKDKAWFFVSYQGTREKNGASLLNSLSTVFVPGVLTNDRTDAGLTALYNKYFPGLGAIYYGLLKNTPQVKMLQAVLPDGRYAIPSAARYTGSILPVATPIPSNSFFREDQFNTNLDLKISENNRLAGKFFFANNPTQQALYSFAGVQNPLQTPGFGSNLDINHRLFALEDTHIISPRVINVARFGISHIAVTSVPEEPFTSAQFGIQSPLSSLFPGAPTVTLDKMMDVGPSQLSDSNSLVRTYSVGDMLTWTTGKHTLKFGAEYKHQQSTFTFNAYTRGQMFFYGDSGLAFQSFLLGVPGATLMGSGVPDRDLAARDFAWFVQDDWRLFPRFTLNVGLRYDYYGPFSDSHGRLVAFDPTLAQTAPVTGGVAVTGGFVQAGNGSLANVPKVQDGLIDGDRNNFAPRIGFSWQPLAGQNSFVVRGGYGIYYDRANARLANVQEFNSPYYMVATNIAVVVPGITMYPQINNPFVPVPLPSTFPFDITHGAPTYINTPVVFNGVNMNFPTPIPAAGTYPDRHDFTTPYVQQYNFGIQYGVKDNWLLDLAYVGSTGRKLYRLRALNQPPAPGAGYAFSGPFSPGLSAASLPLFGTYVMQSSSNSSYNSLQASLTKRFSHGLQFLASYTYSHSLDDYSGSDVSDVTIIPGDQKNLRNWATSDYDRRHRFVFSGFYDVPKLYHGDSGFAKRIVNGWQLASIFTAQTGTPFSIFSEATSLFAQTRADLAPGETYASACGGGGDVGNRLDQYFDKSAFVKPTGLGHFGNTGRNICRGPAQTNVDFSIVKFIPLTEQQKLEFRTEFFNLLNTTNFANPVNISTSSNFGQIVRTSTGPRVIQFALKYSF